MFIRYEEDLIAETLAKQQQELIQLKVNFYTYAANCLWSAGTASNTRLCDPDGTTNFITWNDFINPPAKQPKEVITKQSVKEQFKRLKAV